MKNKLILLLPFLLISLITMPQISRAQISEIPSDFQFKTNLYKGLTSDGVKYLQIVLKELGSDIYPEGLVVGSYGSLTEKAVTNFQLKYGVISLVADPGAGNVGPQTRTKLNEILSTLRGGIVSEEKTTTPKAQSSSLSKTVSGDLTVTGNIKASGLYQEEGDLVVNNLGSGNLYFTANKSMYLTARQIILDVKLPAGGSGIAAVYIQDPLYVNGALSSGDLTVSGNLTVSGTQTFSGSITANGQVDLGDNGDTITINSSDWDIGATGNMTNIGNITADGTINFTGGSLTLGDAASDTLTVNASTTIASHLATLATTTLGSATSTPAIFIGWVQSNIYPFANLTYDLGSSTQKWRNIYVGTTTIGSTITIGSADISASGALTVAAATNLTASSTNDIILTTAGSERMRIDDTTGGISIGTSTFPALFSVATSTNIFNILTSGFVGIGTTSPASLLELYDWRNNADLTITAATSSTNDARIVFRTGASAPTTRFIIGADQSANNNFVISTTTLGTADLFSINYASTSFSFATNTFTGLFNIGTSTNIFNVAAGGTISMPGLKNGFMKVNASGDISTSTIDISANTNLTAGRSLTLTDDDIAADAELFTRTAEIAFTSATTSGSRVDMYWNPGVTITITEIGCISDGTMDLQFGEAAENTLATSSKIANITCTTSSASTTTFVDSAIAARGRIMGRVTLITSATSSWATIKYTVDD